jgi:hypothetical protein
MKILISLFLSLMLLFSCASTGNNYSTNKTLSDQEKNYVNLCVSAISAETESQRLFFEGELQKQEIDCSLYAKQIQEELKKNETNWPLYIGIAAVLIGGFALYKNNTEGPECTGWNCVGVY